MKERIFSFFFFWFFQILSHVSRKGRTRSCGFNSIPDSRGLKVNEILIDELLIKGRPFDARYLRFMMRGFDLNAATIFIDPPCRVREKY